MYLLNRCSHFLSIENNKHTKKPFKIQVYHFNLRQWIKIKQDNECSLNFVLNYEILH